MNDWISPILVVDLALAWIIVETLLALIRNRSPNRSMSCRWTLANAAAGTMLLLALRSVLSGWDQPWFLVFMSAAGVAHVIEFTSRSR